MTEVTATLHRALFVVISRSFFISLCPINILTDLRLLIIIPSI